MKEVWGDCQNLNHYKTLEEAHKPIEGYHLYWTTDMDHYSKVYICYGYRGKWKEMGVLDYGFIEEDMFNPTPNDIARRECEEDTDLDLGEATCI